MTNFFNIAQGRRIMIQGLLLVFCISMSQLVAQTNPRLVAIKANLTSLEIENPGLGEKTELSVSGIALDEFLRAIAKTHKLNLSIAAGLTEPVTNNFSNVTVSEILFFLAENYNLDYQFSANIISIKHYNPPKDTTAYKAKILKINRDSVGGVLTVDFKNDSIHLVTRQLTTLTGENIVYAPELSNKLITLYIQNASLYKTLEQMAFANQLGIEYAEDSVYRLMPLAAKTAGSTESNRKPGRQQRGALEFVQNKDSSYTLSADNQNIGDIIK